MKQSNDTYVLYFAAMKLKGESPHMHCVGTAISHGIQGPYFPADTPLACHEFQGGAIDASGFLDPRSGQRYVTYKVDGNNIGSGGNCNNGVPPFKPTPIMLQRVQADGVTIIGNPIRLIDRDVADGPLVEAPSIIMLGGKYFLFFSSNCYVTDMYDVTFAVADHVEGPYRKRGPLILSKTFGMHGPGGAEVISMGDKEAYMAFHAGKVGQRLMYEAKVEYIGGSRLRVCLPDNACIEAD
jgi:beta-xylosidase